MKHLTCLRRTASLALLAGLVVSQSARSVDSEQVMKTKLCDADSETPCADVLTSSGVNRLAVDSSPSSSVVSSANSTTTPLGSSATFTGTFEDILPYADVTIIVRANVAGTLTVQWSSDGTNIDDTDVYSYIANTGKQYSFGAMARYVRVVFANGGSAQASFRLQTVHHRVRGKPSSHRIDDVVVADDDAELVKAALTGKSPDDSYKNVHVDGSGNLIVTTIEGFGADFVFGDVTVSSLTTASVNRTTYTEPASAAAFSIKSSSASDTAAGTGARTVRVQWMSGTFGALTTETVTLNGTTCVNSSATTARFFEAADVLTVGSSGANAGILTLYTGTGCTTVVGTIAVSEEQTFWAHHYIATGKTCNITGLSVSHNGTTVGSGGVFAIKALDLSASNANEIQVSDFHRLYGQASTTPRTYSSPIKVSGPSRLQVYVTPETSSSTVYRASIDFFEQ